jgi:hypothetical protein
MIQGRGENWAEVELPEGVDPVEVEVYCVGLGYDSKPVGEPTLVKPYERRDTFTIEPSPIVPPVIVPTPDPVDLTTFDEPEDEEDEPDTDADLEPSPDLEPSDDLELSDE